MSSLPLHELVHLRLVERLPHLQWRRRGDVPFNHSGPWDALLPSLASAARSLFLRGSKTNCSFPRRVAAADDMADSDRRPCDRRLSVRDRLMG